MALNSKQRLDLIEFLVPLLGDESKRKTYFDLVCADHRNRPDINLHGTPRNVTSQMVIELERFMLEPGKPALVEFLDLIKRWDVGEDHYPQIEAWQTSLLTPAAPPSQSTSVGTQRAAPEPKPAPVTPSKAEQFSLPAPFEWITIPAGRVTLEGKNQSYLKTDTRADVSAFGIGKYPVTNAQYKQFMESGSYREKALWTKKGWKWLSDHRGRFSEKMEMAQTSYDCPALVTWFEAMAYCLWLRSMTDEPVLLPTEQQWQRAAQGEDERLYPWGSVWSGLKCNNSVPPEKGTGLMSVKTYEKIGDSPYNVLDMVGNAAEWCLTNWSTGEQGGDGDDARVVRGGSYQNQHLNFYRVTTRHKEFPYAECGFRIVRLLDT